MELTNELIEKYTPMVERVARKQHKGMTVLETEDIEQAIWLHVVERTDNMFLARGGLMREDKDIEGLMHRAAAQYCREQRQDYQYFTGAFLYSVEDVERILEESAWARTDEVVDIDGRVDVLTAYQKLSLGQQDVLYRVYGLKESGLPAASRVTLQRARERITALLNEGAAYSQVELTDPAVEQHLAAA